MYITWVVYVLFIALCVWGGRFAGFGRGKFHEDSASLDVTKALRGIAATGVILHHISQEESFQQAGVIQAFCNVGFLFVAVFFFWSGFGLIKSLASKPGYLDGFMRKRVLRVLVIPFYVSVILYAPLCLLTGEMMTASHWVCNFLGVTMMNEYAWYPIVAAILYTAFYVIFRKVKGDRPRFVLMAAVILALGLIFCVNGHFAWWAGEKNWWLTRLGWEKAKWWMYMKIFWFSGEWWVNSCPAFLIGMLFARYEDRIRAWFARSYWGKLILLALLTAALTGLSAFGQWKFGYWTEFSGNGPGILNKMLTYLLQIPQSMIVVILIFAVMLKYHASNPVTRFMGSISLETYMMNLMALAAFRFLLYKGYGPDGSPAPVYWAGNGNLALYAAAVIAATIGLASVYRLLCKLVQRLFTA